MVCKLYLHKYTQCFKQLQTHLKLLKKKHTESLHKEIENIKNQMEILVPKTHSCKKLSGWAQQKNGGEEDRIIQIVQPNSGEKIDKLAES